MSYLLLVAILAALLIAYPAKMRVNWLKFWKLTKYEQHILNALNKWPEGSYRVGERGSLFVDPKVVNQLPETIKARELARKIVEGH